MGLWLVGKGGAGAGGSVGDTVGDPERDLRSALATLATANAAVRKEIDWQGQASLCTMIMSVMVMVGI